MALLICIITDPQGRILLASGPGGWQLPQFDAPAPEVADTWEVRRLPHLVRQRLGVEAWPLYAMEVQAGETPAYLAAFDNGSVLGVGAPLRFADAGQAGRFLASAGEQALLAGHFASVDLCAPTGLTPWLGTGWWEEVERWLVDELYPRRLSPVGRPMLVTSRFVGRTFWTKTADRPVFFKATSLIWCREIAITRELAAWRPRHVPPVVAVDPARGWMITREVEGWSLPEVPDVQTWETALRTYAQLQRDSSAWIAQGGLPSLFDWRPETVSAGLAPLLDEMERLQEGYEDPIPAEDLAALRAGLPEFEALCRQVADTGVPSALEHQDLHPGNVRVVDGVPVFLDWAWSAVTHPFLSLSRLPAPNLMPEELLPFRDRLRRAYFEVWRDYGTPEHLEEVAALVHRWSVVQYAVCDAEWLRALFRALPPGPFPREWYLSRMLQMRQYYWVKCLRRMLRLLS